MNCPCLDGTCDSQPALTPQPTLPPLPPTLAETHTPPLQPTQPPLPPPLPRPAQASRENSNPHCQAACLHARHTLEAEQAQGMPAAFCAQALLPGFQHQQQQQQQHWTLPPSAQHGHMELNSMPPISAMLIREAEAWRALMGLHGSVVNLSRTLASVSASDAGEFAFDEQREASDQREAAYLASLSQLCAACDGLVAEAVKVRGLRKAKHQIEQQSLREVMRAHSDETLATGDAIARSSSLGIVAVTAELRATAQTVRTQIQQARALVSASAEARAFGNVDSTCTVVMGLLDGTGEPRALRPVATVLEQVYQRGQLTDENLAAAIWQGDKSQVETSQNRVFSRRAGDRQMQRSC